MAIPLSRRFILSPTSGNSRMRGSLVDRGVLRIRGFAFSSFAGYRWNPRLESTDAEETAVGVVESETGRASYVKVTRDLC